MTVARRNAQPEDGGDIDDAAAAPAAGHALAGDLSHAPDTIEIGGEHGPPVLFTDFQRSLPVTNTGVVEDHIDHAEVGFGHIEGGLDAGPVGDVQGNRQYLAVLPLDIRCHLLQPLDTSSRQHHPSAGTGGQSSEMRADAAGGAGDQHHAIGEGKVLNVMRSHGRTSDR
ncbi:hypothetical protein D9M70_515370 [compost metagenome]